MTIPTEQPGTTITSVTRVVDHPVEKVWAALVDHEAMSTWAPGLAVTLDRPGTSERNGVGAVRRIAAPGPVPAIVEEITVCDSPHVLGYRARSGVPFRDYSGRVTLRGTGTRTEITWTLTARPRLGAERLALGLVARVLLASLVRSLRGA